MHLVDTHCHIHFSDYKLDPTEVIGAAKRYGVTGLICVGCSLEDSQSGINFAAQRKGVYAAAGLHPHEAKKYMQDQASRDSFSRLASESKVVAIGECGLDYFYNFSPKEDQKELFKFQLDIASKHNLPVIFHVREAFSDFWQIVDQYPGITGVVHSFSAGSAELAVILDHKFFVGLNGIMTFTKNPDQLSAAKAVPLASLLLETDAPYLTPSPYRGKVNQPKYVLNVAEFLCNLRGEKLEDLASATTNNATNLFRTDFNNA
jgi:TatD DNase family protein